MAAQETHHRAAVRHVTAAAGALALVWVLFVASSFSDFLMAQSTGHRPVFVNNTYVGNVELYPLQNANIGGTFRNGINVIFHPVNNDLNIINIYRLNWWQVANRRGEPGYPRIDVQNQGHNLPGNPGDDNDPAYWTNNERSSGAIRNVIFNQNNWWIQDYPGPGNGIQFETWIVTTSGNNVRRLVCLNWGIGGNGGTQAGSNQPNFINGTEYPDLTNLINNSGFGNYWRELATVQSAYQPVPFMQGWSNPGLITANDDWSGVPGIIGYLGDHDAGAVTGVDPRTLNADIPVAVDVIANQNNPNALTNGGVAEFEIPSGGVALQGSGTADAPFLRLHLNTTGFDNVLLSFVLRDIDGSADNAIQQVAAQFRVGGSGPWQNIPGTYVPDATQGPGNAGFETPIVVSLPPAANNQAELEIRILTTNAAGNDEWVAIRNISVTGSQQVAVPGVSLWVMAALAMLFATGGAVLLWRRRESAAA